MEEDISRSIGAVMIEGGSPDPTNIDSVRVSVDQIYDIGSTTSQIIGSVKVASILSRNVSKSKTAVHYVPQSKTFQSKGRHSTMSPEELSEWWKIGIKKARKTIAKTTKRLTRSEGMPLLRRNKADRVFQTKKISGMWDTDTMDGRLKSIDRNRYEQVFYNGTYFAEMYPMSKKDEALQALKTFVMELGVPEKLVVDRSK